MRCFGCGIEKDPRGKEFFTGEYDGLIDDEPISSLFVLDVQPSSAEKKKWKATVVCHGCFDRLEPDMWISENCWKSLDPVLVFDDLPELPEGYEYLDNPAFFEHVKVTE